MCSKISWEQFLTVAAAITAIYYIVVGVMYYRKDIQSIIKNEGRGQGSGKQASTPPMSYNEFTAQSGDAFTDERK